MFVFSFKASNFKIICVLLLCVVGVALSVALLPGAGHSLNVNKIESVAELNKINVKNEEGRLEYLEVLGYDVNKEPVAVSNEKLPKVFDAVTEKYNDLQRVQGFDLTKYAGKKLTGYTYEITAFPDETKLGDTKYLVTLIVYKDKVVAADVCCPESGKYAPLIKAA